MPVAAVPTYDTIGLSYTKTRQADPRIVDALVSFLALPPGCRIADIGAGTGNYTYALADRGYFVDAVEPSAVMRGQAASHDRVRWHEGVAEHLPLTDRSVQGCVSTLALHHFTDIGQALGEMERVAGSGPFVFLTFDYRLIKPLWLADYFPKLWEDAVNSLPPLQVIASQIQTGTDRSVEVIPFPLPFDLTDMFLAAGWRQPEIYLDPTIRAGISSFALGDSTEIESGLARLRSDLDDGTWEKQYGWLRNLQKMDAGYRFLRVASQ